MFVVLSANTKMFSEELTFFISSSFFIAYGRFGQGIRGALPGRWSSISERH